MYYFKYWMNTDFRLTILSEDRITAEIEAGDANNDEVPNM